MRGSAGPIRATEIHGLASDLEEDFVQVPPVRRPWSAPTDPVGVNPAELERPAPDGLIGRIDAALGEHVLDIAIAQCEPEVEPDSMLDDRRWKAMTGVGQAAHAIRYRALAHSATGLT